MAISPPSSPSRSLDRNYESRLRSPSKPIRSSSGRRRSSINGSMENPKKEKSVYSDRFIPSRSGTQLETGFTLLGGSDDDITGDGVDESAERTSLGGPATNSAGGSSEICNRDGLSAYSMLLRNELLGCDDSPHRNHHLGNVSRAVAGSGYMSDEKDSNDSGTRVAQGKTYVTSSPSRNLFRFKTTQQTTPDLVKSFSLSPIGTVSQTLFESPRKMRRKTPKAPFKILDAPSLQDDFYLNLVDWSSMNVLAVGLGSCVYLWSACTSKVTKLCDLGPDDSVASLSWTQRGMHLAVGTYLGEVQIWDAAKCKKIRMMGGHAARVGTLAWNAHVLASGSRDRLIYQRDVRVPEFYTGKLVGHKQEVCGMKWSFDEQMLASGGNDNKLFLWSTKSTKPVNRFDEHTAAVKAIAWSPHRHGLLASGGGTADRCIRFWNTLTGSPLSCIDTGSQVCNLIWSKNVNELVSTHGYSLNQIIIWKYPSMTKIATLTGHTYRVLYLTMSPDGQTIVTGAGDETLRFWNVFPGLKNKDGSRLGTSLLFPAGANIR